MQDAAEIRLHGGADEGGAVHHAGDLLQSLTDLETVDRGVNRGKRTQHAFDLEPFAKWFVAFGIEGIRRGHATAHPEKNAGIGPGGQLTGGFPIGREGGHRLTGGPCGGPRRSQLAQKITPGDRRWQGWIEK